MERRLYEELRTLSLRDEELREAVMQLGNAQLALGAARGRVNELTREREVFSGDGALPFGAERVMEVIVAGDAWNHLLTHSTFAIAQLSGNIRRLDLDCNEGTEGLEYEADVEWTIPSSWTGCIVRVRASRDTTFALYEF